MWYETLPPLIIIGASVWISTKGLHYYYNKWRFGYPMRRDLSNPWDSDMFIRDHILTGAAWVRAGLETIPDMESDAPK